MYRASASWSPSESLKVSIEARRLEIRCLVMAARKRVSVSWDQIRERGDRERSSTRELELGALLRRRDRRSASLAWREELSADTDFFASVGHLRSAFLQLL